MILDHVDLHQADTEEHRGVGGSGQLKLYWNRIHQTRSKIMHPYRVGQVQFVTIGANEMLLRYAMIVCLFGRHHKTPWLGSQRSLGVSQEYL